MSRASFAIAVLLMGAAPATLAATVRYVHTDHLGSPVMETDSTGNIISERHYRPFGEEVGGSGQDGIGFTGHYRDGATELVYMQQRYYDPAMGRFASRDPVSTNDIGSNFNRYWYADNDPYRYVDPDGRTSTPGKHGETQCHASQVEPKVWPTAPTGSHIVGAAPSSYVLNAPTSAFGGTPGTSGTGTTSKGPEKSNRTATGLMDDGTTAKLAAAAAAARTRALWSAVKTIIGGVLRGPAFAALLSSSSVQGEPVYRVWGGRSQINGNSWTPVDPRTVPDFRNAVGLPNWNDGSNLTMGYLHDRNGVIVQQATPLHGYTGGLPEYVVRNPSGQIHMMWTRPVDPPY